ncbi:MAG TPA: phenylalanine--tRNA ligase subunit beta [Bacteroidia bacterium]|nr:phenylalanine--tRNA ligase subunit beta [Bacteroidia bacterium]
MKISYNWLKQYIPIDLPVAEVSALLTNCGLEVEALEKFEIVKGGLKGVVIGEVIEKQKHPNADRLSVTKVNTGSGEPLQIVCGAPNVEAGQKVVVALIGSTLYPFSGEPFEIKKSKIRGELSEGMICAEDEIGFGTSHEGIMVLQDDATIGTSAADYFKLEEDWIFEIGLTPNRADAASHIGVARDLVAVLNSSSSSDSSKLLLPSVDTFKTDNHDLHIEAVIENKKDCIRYSGISLTQIKVAESPEWLKNRLKSIGLKPINNIVDISNYVLFETGQPLHIFDADEISGKKIIVKNLSPKTKFITLDEKERELNGEELMICNANEAMCIAGIFGGIKSGVTEKTKNIFIESACFHPASIRKSSKYHGLKTDASFRFERGTDPDNTVYALKRAAMMIKEICGGTISSDIVDVYPSPVQNAKVEYDFKRTSLLMGMEIKPGAIKTILNDLGIKVNNENPEALELSIPNNKVDVKRETDVVEEVMRIYGYNRVPLPSKMNMPLPKHTDDIKEKFVNSILQFIAANGFYETVSNSLTKESYAAILNKREEAAEILNPLSNDLSIMRQTLLFSGLEAIQYNRNRKNPDLRFFEFGKTYHKTGLDSIAGYKEINHLSIFLTGNRYAETWIKNSPVNYSIYFLKSLLNNLFVNSGVEEKDIVHRKSESDLLNTSLEIFISKKKVAEYGILNSSLQKSFDVDEDVYYADILTDELMSAVKSSKHQISEVPKFPRVKRDISMLIDKNTSYAEMEKLAFETERKLLISINLFDVYEGDNIEKGKISCAISFILRDDEKTLTDKQIDSVMEKLMNAFESKLGAQIRK